MVRSRKLRNLDLLKFVALIHVILKRLHSSPLDSDQITTFLSIQIPSKFDFDVHIRLFLLT